MDSPNAGSTSETLPDESGVSVPPEVPALDIPPQPPAGLPHRAVSNQDIEHIKILSICYYVTAGLTALMACLPIFHLFMGAAMASGAMGGAGVSSHEQEMMQIMGGLVIGMASLFILGGWVLAVLNFVVAKKMVRRESRVLCLITAGINCLNVPLGTALGVFTFIVLSRPQVVQSFEERAASRID